MALPLARPDHIRVRILDGGRSSLSFARRHRPVVRAAVEVVGRGLAVGVGLGILLIAGPGAASLTALGILALGAALLSWDR